MAARKVKFANAFSELALLVSGAPTKPWRYLVYYGGRGSGKSMSIAIALVMIAMTRRTRILCARELQNSITESVHKLICDVIELYGLESEFTVTNTSIKSSCGSEFIFKGLRHSISEIKSMHGVDICWVEEAQAVPADSWDVLTPTIRSSGSMFIVSFNPDEESDDTYQRFVVNPDHERTYVRKVNYDENDWFPEELRAEMEHLKALDYERYLNVWKGFPKKVSDALIFKGKYRVEAFDTPKYVDRFYFGADWGFSNDPTVLVRSFVEGNTLFIDYEAHGIKVDVADTPALFLKVPESFRWLITADSARPETISAMTKAGFHIKKSKKGPGSIIDGIEHIRSFDEIVIHPRCELAAENFSNYSYKVDKDGQILNKEPADKHSDCIDALRYALEPLMRRKKEVRQIRHRIMER